MKLLNYLDFSKKGYYSPDCVVKLIIFLKISVKSTIPQINHSVNWFHEFFSLEKNSCAHTAQCGKRKHLLSTKINFRQINSLVFSLVKTLLSRNFCQRSVTVNFRIFHTVAQYLSKGNAENAITQKKIPWNQLFNNSFSKNVGLTEKCRFFYKNGDRDFGDFPHCGE